MATKEQKAKIASVRKTAKKVGAFKVPDLPSGGILKRVGAAAKKLGGKIGKLEDRSQAFIEKNPGKVLKRLAGPAVAGEVALRARKKQKAKAKVKVKAKVKTKSKSTKRR